VRVEILPPIETDGLHHEDRDALTARLRALADARLA
jgi:hypothetical protein